MNLNILIFVNYKVHISTFFRYVAWFNSAVFPIRRLPKLFKLISTKACKMFKKFLDPRPFQRVKTLSELNKYLDDRWLGRHAEKEFLGESTISHTDDD
jgi:hypothetical protein